MGMVVGSVKNITSALISGITGKSGTENEDVSGVIKDTYEHVDKTSLDTTDDTVKTKLSDKAQKVLDELKEKYGNTDFFVADYSSDEEAGQILSNSTKEFGVVITPDELEKMADDEKYKEKFSGIISDSEKSLSDYMNGLSDDDRSSVKSIGFSIKDDGTVNYFAEIEKQLKAIADKREETKDAAGEKKYLQAGTLNGLGKAIDDFITSKTAADTTGMHVDLQA